MSVIKCARCGKRFRKNLDGWNVEMLQGVPQWYVCPVCQKPEESTAAEVREATLDYGRDSSGRVIARPRVALPAPMEAVVLDLIRRTEEAAHEVAHVIVNTGVTMTVRDIVEKVERGLPVGYPRPAVGSRLDLLTRIATDVMTGDLYDDHA